MFVRHSLHWLLRCNAVDGVINAALGSSGIPYLSIVTSLDNFEDNPAQSMGSLVGMYFGGPIGAAIGGAIFKYDLAGFTLANGARGFMYLEWTDEQVQTQTRYYVGAGSRGKGLCQTLTLQNHTADALGVVFQPEAAHTSCFLKAA